MHLFGRNRDHDYYFELRFHSTSVCCFHLGNLQKERASSGIVARSEQL
jgi:hypothetical protein